MAPFGRNFLKARLKNRSKDAEEAPNGKEIQVSVCQEEKVVCGVTKHTTCADVVQALLEDHKNLPESKTLLHGEPKDFCLLERWKGFERALPPLTRILRLWNAWGDERPFIQFVLVKTNEFVPPSCAKQVSKSRAVRSKRWEHGPAQYAKTLPAERQKRMVKKAFRKLEKMQKLGSTEGSEEIDKMVQLIISQDHVIRQQLCHMQELDLEIKLVENQLRESLSTSSSDTSLDESTEGRLQSQLCCEDQLQEYLYTSEGLTQLELQVLGHQQLIDELSRDIDLELRKAVWMTDSEELQGATAASPTPDFDLLSPLSSEEALELDTLQSKLDLSMSAGLSIHVQSQDLEKELQHNSTMLQSRNQEYHNLIAQLSSLQVEDSPSKTSPVSLKSNVKAGICQQQHTPGKLRHNISSPTDITDTDSDTGISSTHSQDSLSPCIERKPPLDTDV